MGAHNLLLTTIPVSLMPSFDSPDTRHACGTHACSIHEGETSKHMQNNSINLRNVQFYYC